MILDEFVEVSWCPSNKDHYVYLGLVFTKFGDRFKIRPEDLPDNSTVCINLKCNTCNTTYSLGWRVYRAKKNKHECANCPSRAKKTLEFLVVEFDKCQLDLLATNYVNRYQLLEYRCRKHPEHTQRIRYNDLKNGSGCYHCGVESSAAKRRITEEQVFKLLAGLNYEFYEFVLDGKPLSSTTKIKYVCPHHQFDVQVTHYNNLQQGRRCPMCATDGKRYRFSPNKYTTIREYFRHYLHEWKDLTEKLCNYQCILTGERRYNIHHHVPFNKILKEALANVNLPKHKVAKHYTETELATIVAELKRLHEVYGPGVCLSDILHIKLHSRYGRRKEITKEQFEEFCALFHVGEILEKNKHINFDF